MSNFVVFSSSPDNLKTQIYGSNVSVPVGTDNQGGLSAGITNVGPNVNSLLNKLQTTVNSSVIQLYPQYGISVLRDTITVVGAATVTTASNGNGYQLSTTAVALNAATLDSAINSQHNMGTAAEAAIEVLLPASPTGNQVVRWGAFSDQDGFCFGQDSTGIFISTRLAGVETKVYQSSWNGDKLNGTGASGLTLNLAKGNQFQFTYIFAFGVVEFRVVMQNASNIEQVVTVHRYRLSNAPNMNDPNLPIRAQVQNGATAIALSLYVYSRSYAILGVPEYSQRITSERRLLAAPGSVTFIPLISFRRKIVFPPGTTRPNSVTVFIQGVDFITDKDCIWEIRLGSTLTGASFTTPVGTLSTETCLEVDVSATAIDTATGVMIYEGLAQAGNKALLTSQEISLVVPANQIISLAVRAISGPAATVSAVLRMRELW